MPRKKRAVRAKLRKNLRTLRDYKNYCIVHPDEAEEVMAERRRANHNRAKKKYQKRKRAEARAERIALEKAEAKKAAAEARETEKAKAAEERKAMRAAEREEAKKAYWMIVGANNNHITSLFGRFHLKDDAMAEFGSLRSRMTKAAVFPKIVRNNNGFHDFKNECLLLRRRDGKSTDDKFFRNEYGEMAEHEIVSGFGEEWMIWNKFQYEVEETFPYVGQRHMKSERKTFSEIWDEFVVGRLADCDGFIGIQRYANKIIFRDGFKAFQMVATKTKDEGKRFISKLSEMTEENKLRRKVVFMDDVSRKTSSGVLDELVELTGFDRGRIIRVTTQH